MSFWDSWPFPQNSKRRQPVPEPAYPYTPAAQFELYSAPPPVRISVYTDDGPATWFETRMEKYQRLSTPLPKTEPAITLTLEKCLHSLTRCNRITQVFTAYVKFHIPGSEALMVAKIYDPLYVRGLEGNPILLANIRTADEVDAFKRLASMQGICIPEFYGCFLCPLPGQERNVYVLLMQYIPGITLSTFTRADAGSAACREVMNIVAKIDKEMVDLGVMNFEMGTRNTIFSNFSDGKGLRSWNNLMEWDIPGSSKLEGVRGWYGFKEGDLSNFSTRVQSMIRLEAPKAIRSTRFSPVVLVGLGRLIICNVGSNQHEEIRKRFEQGFRCARYLPFKDPDWKE